MQFDMKARDLASEHVCTARFSGTARCTSSTSEGEEETH